MIDTKTEKLIALAAVPSLPMVPTRNGKPISVQTVYTWARVGIRGVKLEIVHCGRALFTTAEAIQRFYERLAMPDAKRTTPAERRKAFNSASALLDAAGF